MPFAAQTNYDDPNDPNKKGGAQNVSGASTSFSTGIPGQEAAGGGKAAGPGKSGQYTNIQDYLKANTQQADSMGQKIASTVDQKGQEATQKIQGFESQAPKVEAFDPNAVIQKATAGQLSDEDKQVYKTQKQTGGYTGPQQLDQVSGYQDAQDSYSKAANDVKAVGKEEGQQQLLKQQYARPDYTAGQNKLDQVLLQNSAGSKAALEGVANKYASLDSMFSGAQQNVGDAVNAANAQALANKQAFDPAEQAALSGLLDPINARAQQMQAEAKAQQAAINNELLNGNLSLSQTTLDALGLTAGTQLWGNSLKKYYSDNETPVNADLAASADERAKYGALTSLFGQDPTAIGLDDKQYSAVNFDKESLAKDQAAAKQQYDSYMVAPSSGFTDYVRSKYNPDFSLNSSGYGVNDNNSPAQLAEVAPQLLASPYASQRQVGQAMLDYLNQINETFGANNIIKLNGQG